MSESIIVGCYLLNRFKGGWLATDEGGHVLVVDLEGFLKGVFAEKLENVVNEAKQGHN